MSDGQSFDVDAAAERVRVFVRRERNASKRLRRARRANPPKGPSAVTHHKLDTPRVIKLQRRTRTAGLAEFTGHNRHARRVFSRQGFKAGLPGEQERTFRSVRVERADGRCVTRKPVEVVA